MTVKYENLKGIKPLNVFKSRIEKDTYWIEKFKKFSSIENNYWKYAETPRSPWQEEGWRMRKEKEPSRQKKESHSLSAVTSGGTTPKSFLLVVEDAMRPSRDDALAILSTSTSCLFY